MKRQWLGMIGLRLVGVYALIEALASFPRLAAGGMLLARDGRGGLIPFLVLFPYGVLLASGVLLLAHPAKAAGLVWPRGVGADDVQISADVANLAFAAAGIIVLAHALPDLVWRTVAQAEATGALSLRSLSGGLAQVLLAMFLMSNPGTIADLCRATDAALPADEDDRNDRETVVRLGALAVAVAGAVQFAASLPALVPGGLALLSRAGRGDSAATVVSLSGEVARAALGALLFFRATSVIEFLRRRRTAQDLATGQDRNPSAPLREVSVVACAARAGLRPSVRCRVIVADALAFHVAHTAFNVTYRRDLFRVLGMPSRAWLAEVLAGMRSQLIVEQSEW